MTVALNGALILKESSGYFEWKPKCEKCGYVQDRARRQGSIRAGYMQEQHTCMKCGHRQPVKFGPS